jgi:hypothetical protein
MKQCATNQWQPNAASQNRYLFDHLVSAGEQGGRDVEPEYLGGLKVYDKLEFGRAIDRQIGWRFALRMRPA